MPTDTPTITPTPGPLFIKDDFSSQSDIWEDCDQCEWKDGQLLVGPYEAGGNAGENLNFIVCTGCGEHMYYRVAVDVTFVDGQVDRYFGMLAPMTFSPEGDYLRLFYLGLSTLAGLYHPGLQLCRGGFETIDIQGHCRYCEAREGNQSS